MIKVLSLEYCRSCVRRSKADDLITPVEWPAAVSCRLCLRRPLLRSILLLVVVSSCLEDISLVEFMYLVFRLHACYVRVTVDDTGLCCCVCVTSFGMKPKQEESTQKGGSINTQGS